ncbi:MAG: GTP 3',8-cyclase MoaA [Clostridiales bacterium]
MKDSLSRTIDYMRVSITDRCNLRCQYCMPNGLPWIEHSDILRYEEFLEICGGAAIVGISTIKVTGGEPLARKDCVRFLGRLKELPGIERVTLTTNGLLLEPHVAALAAMKLDGVNISLDTLQREVYQRLTGTDGLAKVLEVLEKTVAAGLKVKINCVPILGINDGEVAAIAALVAKIPVDVRFIELMPTASSQAFTGLTGEAVLSRLLEEYPDLSPTSERRGFGPARYYASESLIGRIGLIDAVSNHFCGQCNRIRLTSQGFLKLCLYHERGVDLRRLLRQGAGREELAAAIKEAILHKPESHCFGQEDEGQGIKNMSRIGG